MSVSRSAGPAVTRAQHIPHDSAQLAAGSPAGLTATPHFCSLPLTLRPWGSPVFPWPRAKPGSGSFPRNPIRQHLHLLLGSAVGRTLSCAIPAGVLGSPPALARHSLLPTRATLPWYRQGLGLSPAQNPDSRPPSATSLSRAPGSSGGPWRTMHQSRKRFRYPRFRLTIRFSLEPTCSCPGLVIRSLLLTAEF